MNKAIEELLPQVEELIIPVYRRLDAISAVNHRKVLQAFRDHQVSDYHLKGTTGYGYSDSGRDTLEKIYAQIFGAEAALVRGQIVSGTHAIALCLYGVLRPGDLLVSATGAPYDTLEEIIGLRGITSGSLKEYGVNYLQVNLTPDYQIDLEALEQILAERPRMVMLQRSRGYSWRPSFSIRILSEAIQLIKEKSPQTIVFVDNCYGELVEELEPTQVGADLVAGSLIKNLGGGLAPTGGYIAGRRDLVEMASHRWTAPGIGAAVGSTLDLNRILYQGLFLAPHIVTEALKGAVFAAALFNRLGYPVSPLYDEERTDLIQAIGLGSREKLIAFCQGLQQGCPVDSHVIPEPWDMPGYGEQVIMAGGTFIQGGTLELSADGPMREPYAVYFQGGLSREYVKLGISFALERLEEIKNY
ncbi:MAG: methionine gamma-lyase family protein [Clostridia bacterium]|nr:methionine gamma-lyase family protein [Clostridia bacterium]